MLSVFKTIWCCFTGTVHLLLIAYTFPISTHLCQVLSSAQCPVILCHLFAFQISSVNVSILSLKCQHKYYLAKLCTLVLASVDIVINAICDAVVFLPALS